MARRWDDHYTRQAREEGYPARSVFKLREIQRRFLVVPRGGAILDVGAAPGSWSLFALRELGCRVTAVDLQPLTLSGNAEKWRSRLTFIRGDILDAGILDQIAAAGPFRAVISDAAPSTSGNRITDAAASAELVRQVIGLARRCLAPGGNLVAKILQGGAERELLSDLRGYFDTARAFKPRASRQASSEVFLVGLGCQKG